MTIESLAIQALIIVACTLMACSAIENKFKKKKEKSLTTGFTVLE